MAADVDAAHRQRLRVGVGAHDRPVGERAPPVAALRAAVAGGEQHVGARPLQRRHHHVERVRGTVGVVARMPDREVPLRRERPPRVADHQRPGGGGLVLQHRAQMRERRHRVGQQAVDRRPAGPPRQQHRDVDHRGARRADERVERAHRAVVHLELARPAPHSGGHPAPPGVEREVAPEAPGGVGGVDPGVEHGQRDPAPVEALGPQFRPADQPLHVVPVAHRRVAAAGEAGLDHRVGEHARDVGAQRQQHRHPGGRFVVGECAAHQHRGVLGGHREVERPAQRERVAAGRRERAGERHGREAGVQFDAGQPVGDVGRARRALGVGHGGDQVGGRAELDHDPHGNHHRGAGGRNVPTFLQPGPRVQRCVKDEQAESTTMQDTRLMISSARRPSVILSRSLR
ncbi:MAG: hypothetical protein K0R62_1881 [Nonomuraea muscovyensis]|nr:hypothetical protein [Nonomuraea muscovyensis]